ncbi:MAG: hypothetical protein ACLSHU_11005 [Oscillospiraceae bacterium]
MGEILQLTEGSMAPVYCLEPGGACEKSERCITYPHVAAAGSADRQLPAPGVFGRPAPGTAASRFALPPAKDRSSGNNGLQVRRIEAWQNQVTPLRHFQGTE